MGTTPTTGRRTQQQRSDATTANLVAAARDLFASQGFADTSLDEITTAAQVTKGAFYHHFESKRDIFRAVCEEEQARLTALQAAAFESKRDPWEGFKAACEAYLTAVVDPGIHRIMLLDAPGVLGLEDIRDLESEAFAAAAAGLEQAMDAGRLRRRAPEPLLDLLFGALGAAAMTVARAEDQPAALRATTRELRRLFEGLATT